MHGDRYRIGILVPFQGPGGIFGPSCVAVSQQARNKLNQHSGIGGRAVELVYIDAGQRPEKIVTEVSGLVNSGSIDALTGWHSSIRKLLVPVLRNRIPYVYTSLSEGDARQPGVYLIGEDPEQQIFPALQWMRDQLSHRRWHVVGASYIWPVRSLQKTALAAHDLGLELVSSTLVEMGQGGDPRLPGAVAASDCDAVLILLVGQDAVDFNRSFAEAGLHDSVTRFSPLMEENMLLASGAEATINLYSSASYFRALTNPAALDFLGRYVSEHGAAAPALNSMGQSCYQGIYLLAELARRSRSMQVSDFNRVIEDLHLDSPRGLITFRNHQAHQPINIARADGLDFDILGTL